MIPEGRESGLLDDLAPGLYIFTAREGGLFISFTLHGAGGRRHSADNYMKLLPPVKAGHFSFY